MRYTASEKAEIISPVDSGSARHPSLDVLRLAQTLP